jgi:hypothetical protein
LLSIIKLILVLEIGTTVSSEPEENIADKGSDVQGEHAMSRLVEEDPIRMSRNSVDGRPQNDLGIVNQ